ncbi:hypothetical protein TTHERM_00129730 (macronuclear) [Tetrahymena thermophila SB210]|uniref:Uncharacterized protein n=1 Tax=Tetrahymena thermophila (strain SB210) TaxID=312017 RepID=I7M1E9_TETTS|nr:hypothetical protein TTHERM_00129730 [Tetrahymena thermophila SB210]EAR96196.2 hypothetical protein TTHERM_00129730 [Tetrahymena thermophila SB210]|eukprot:XP_001016441.2 hypothetical protein TTHERM_00129730 [Tetrahymena thermophila SB210]
MKSSSSQFYKSKQIPDLNLETIKNQNGFQKMQKPSKYGTTHQKIEISKEQFYANYSPSPRQINKSIIVSKVIGSNNNNNEKLLNNSQAFSPSSAKSFGTQPLVFSDSSRIITKVSKISNFSDSLSQYGASTNSRASSPNTSTLSLTSEMKSKSVQSSPKQSKQSEFFKNNELYIREILSLVSNELDSHHSELKQYLHAYGMSGEIFTFYLNRFLENSCGKDGNSQIFFKINDMIYYKTVSLLQTNANFAPILEKLEFNKHKILPQTLMEQICTRDLLKQIIQKVYEEAKNSTFMSEYFTYDKMINTESAIQILEDAFVGNVNELQSLVNTVFGKNKFTHTYFYFFKNQINNALKKQQIPKILIFKILEKIESLRYLIVEDHECLSFKSEIEKIVFQTIQQSHITQKIPIFAQLQAEQLLGFASVFTKNLIFYPEIQIIRRHIKALVNEQNLQVFLIEQICQAITQFLLKKEGFDESIHEISIRKEKLLLSLELQTHLISNQNIIKELIDMIKKGVKKEKHMIDDLKILENPTLIQSYLEQLNSPYNCTCIKDWFGSVQLLQVTSWQIGIWFRILKTSIAKLKLNHQTQFLIEQELNYISNYQ